MEKEMLFNELAGLLTQENEIHQHLIDTAQDMNNCARGNDMDGLKRKSALFDDHVCGLEKAQERRADICGRLQSMLSGAAPSGRMASLIEQSEPQQRGKLKELRAALMERVQKLKALNTSNIVMFREALSGISASINMFKVSTTPKTAYRHKGDFKPNSSCALSLFNEVA
ncbi:MAG: flagellar protein FlgN [Chitinispirillia bacterium]|nr:flagellar protein FlgN [Chitinispirillia bacterium]MCL2269669.1 flagellar protein FlgN [Chitinispirillia bacterium]